MNIEEKEWKEVLAFVRANQDMPAKMDEVRVALVGDLTGSNPGALHTLGRICQDFYQPGNPKRSHSERLVKLEEKGNIQTGVILACSAIAGLIGFLASLLMGVFKK